MRGLACDRSDGNIQDLTLESVQDVPSFVLDEIVKLICYPLIRHNRGTGALRCTCTEKSTTVNSESFCIHTLSNI